MRKRLFIYLWFILFLSACAVPKLDGYVAEVERSETLRGVSLSPRSYQAQDFLDFIDRAAETQDVLLWAGDWNELRVDGAAGVATQIAEENGLMPLIEVGHHIQESGELIRPLNEANKENYLMLTLAYVEEEKPAYFGIGVEVDVFAKKNPDAFAAFVDFYNTMYDEIKAVSPRTQVFTVYQLEAMKGLSYWETQEHMAQWGLLELFKADIAAFTTYPGLVYRDPADIPADHYTGILEHADLPVVLTEIGWHSADFPPGWESSEEEQRKFVQRFAELTDSLPLDIAVWSFMFDQDTIVPFDSMGLITGENREKTAWEAWNGLFK